MTLQERECFMSDFYGEPCCPDNQNLSLDEIDENIEECSAMLNHFIQTSNKKEIAFWRKMLQQAKVQRRSILNI